MYARGISGKLNSQTPSIKLQLDGNTYGMGFQARVSYDYNGDNNYDFMSYSSLFPTDGVLGQYETFNFNLQRPDRDMSGGNIRVELWSTFPVNSAGKLRIGQGASTITIPYDNVSGVSCGAISTPTPSTTVASTPSTTSQNTDKCKDMYTSLVCRTTSDDVTKQDMNAVNGARGWICENYAHHCTAVGSGGAYSDCNAVQQASYAMNSYYTQFAPTQGANACNFNGLGRIYNSASTTSQNAPKTSTVAAPQSSTVAPVATTKVADPVVNPNPVAVRPTPSGDFNARWSTSYAQKVGNVNIVSGQKLLLDVTSVQADVITIESGASLIVDSGLPSLDITAAAIIVKGQFWIGTESQPFTSPVNIVLSGNAEINIDNMVCGTKVVVVGKGGVLEWHGVKGLGKSWTHLAQTAPRGTTTLKLNENFAESWDAASWKVGDDILVAGTDYSPDQAEKVTITKVINSNTVEITPPLMYYHHGTITKGVDERAEVGVLSRTISIRSGSAGRLGAHTMFLAGSTVHIEGVVGVNMGQDQIARYPFHWHMAGDSAGSYIKHSSVLDAIFRCVTVHSSHNVLVQDVVTMGCSGHCMYLEDGVERGNIFRHNLVTNIKEKYNGERMGSDYGMAVSGFWMTSPDNVWEDNVVSGSPGAGYWVHVRMGARGYSSFDSQYKDYRPNLINLRSFNRNKGVGCDHGFQIEATYYDHWNVPQNLVPESPMGAYAPQRNGKDDPIYLDNFTAHHNRFRGLWARAPIVHVRYGKFSNNMEGLQIATSGDHPSPGSVGYITDCLVIGWTDNIGNDVFNNYQMWNYNRQRSWPRNGIPMVGVAYYDGPQVVSGCTFDGWAVDEGETPHSAVGTRFHGEFQVASTNSLSNCQFKNVTHKSYVSDRNGDGGKAFNFRIPDTGMGTPKGTVLTQWGYYSAPNCRQDLSLGLLCPQRYAQLWVIDFDNKAGNQMSIIRNEHTGSNHKDFELTYAGFHSAGIWRYQPLVSVGAHYLVHFKSGMSQSIAFQLNNAEINEAVGITICYPRGSVIKKVTRGYSNKLGSGLLPPIWDTTNKQLNALSSRNAVENSEGYFFDNSRNILTVQVKQRLSRSNYNNFCPDGGCDFIHVEATVPSGAVATDCVNSAYSGDSAQITSGSWLDTKF